MGPTMELRFVKRRVGANVVRILQQKWEDRFEYKWEWRDVPLAKDDEPTSGKIPYPQG